MDILWQFVDPTTVVLLVLGVVLFIYSRIFGN